MNLKNQIYCGDNAELIKSIPDENIDLTVTSPPYDKLRTYNGYEWDFETIAKELYRVTKDGGVVVWVVGDATVNGSETGTSFRQALYFKDECGFNLHDTMIYHKKNQICLTHNRYEQSFEYMFVLLKPYKVLRNMYQTIYDYFLKETNKVGRQKINDVLNNNMLGHYLGYEQFTLPTKENYKKLQLTGAFQKPYDELKQEYDNLTIAVPTFNPIKEKTKQPNKLYNKITSNDYCANSSQRKRNEWVRVKTDKIKSNVFSYSIGYQEQTNSAAFPEALARDHILSWSNPGDLVFDPFAGSGTTLKMAMQCNRYYLGFEISQEYIDIANERLRQKCLFN